MPTVARACFSVTRYRPRSATGSPPGDFVEVETAALQISPGNETHLSAFATEAVLPGRRPARRSTCTLRRNSPARSCSRPARQRIFSFGPVYRNRERGPLHHPEFTMLEWYRAGETYDSLMQDCAALLQLAAERAGAKTFAFRNRQADPFAEPERLSVADAFMRHAGIDLLATVGADGSTDQDALHSAVTKAGLRTAPDDTWTDLFSRVMVERIEPFLGIGRATILYEYPISEAALARPSPRDRQGRRTLRALLLRRRTRQRLRRTHRSGRAAPPLRRRHGREGKDLRRALS